MDELNYLKMATELHQRREQARSLQENYDNEKREALKRFENLITTELTQRDLQEAALRIDELEKELKDGAADWFVTTGQKKWLNGVGGTRVYTKLEYDPIEMVEWALKHDHPDLLKLDTTKFKKVAKTMKIKGVHTTMDAKSFVASDLSKALATMEVTE